MSTPPDPRRRPSLSGMDFGARKARQARAGFKPVSALPGDSRQHDADLTHKVKKLYDDPNKLDLEIPTRRPLRNLFKKPAQLSSLLYTQLTKTKNAMPRIGNIKNFHPIQRLVRTFVTLRRFRPADLKNLKNLRARDLLRKKVIVSALVLALVLAGLYGIVSTAGNSARPAAPPLVGEKLPDNPTYKPLLPENPNTASDSSQQPLNYDKSKQLLNFKDSINSYEIIVSQQPLPPGFVGHTEASLATLALSMGQADKLDTSKGSAYITTDPKTKAQAVFFATQEVLVFMRTGGKISPQSWIIYINSLKLKQ